MHAQMIRPHTTAPTAHAAIQDPCHRVSITFPCLVTGSGQPSRVNSLLVQPDRAITTRPSAAADSARRPRERGLLPGGKLTQPESGGRRAVALGGTHPESGGRRVLGAGGTHPESAGTRSPGSGPAGPESGTMAARRRAMRARPVRGSRRIGLTDCLPSGRLRPAALGRPWPVATPPTACRGNITANQARCISRPRAYRVLTPWRLGYRYRRVLTQQPQAADNPILRHDTRPRMDQVTR